MYFRPRRRHVVSGSRLPALSSLLVGAVLLGAFVMLFRWGWSVLSFPLKGETPATLLTVIGRGEVQVSLAGSSELRTAQTGLRLYPDDRIITPRNAYAELSFFEGTIVRLGEASEVLIDEILRNNRDSLLSLILEEGSLWIETGEDTASRTLDTAQASFSLTPSLTALFEDTSSMFFDTSGPGVEVRIPSKGRRIATLTVGEGQSLTLSEDSVLLLERGEDPYRARRALPPDVFDLPFVRFNQSQFKTVSPPLPPVEGTEAAANLTPLVLLSPKDGERVSGNTVTVRGQVSERVRNLRINGYDEPIRGPLFEKEISLADEEEVTISVTVEDEQGIEIGSERRTVHRDLQPPPAPVILQPGSGGSIVTLTEPETVIEGTATNETVTIIVNGYRLQQFTEGDTEWRYIASAELQNLSFGSNTYTVVAHDRSGNVSAPATITLVWEGGKEEAEATGTGLTVFSPSTESPFETSEPEILLEGNSPPETSTISINGYQLRLFKSGSPTWNYILREDFGNLHLGLNRYVIEAKDAEGNVLARMTYQVKRTQ